MPSSQRQFWARIICTAFVVNAPLAIAVVAGSVSLVFGVVLSSVLGVAILVIWDGSRVPAEAASPAARAELRQVDEAVERTHSQQNR